MLTHMLGNSYSMQDLLAYILAAVAIIATGFSKATKAAQLPLVLLAVLSLVLERMVVQSFHHRLDVDHTGQVCMYERTRLAYQRPLHYVGCVVIGAGASSDAEVSLLS